MDLSRNGLWTPNGASSHFPIWEEPHGYGRLLANREDRNLWLASHPAANKENIPPLDPGPDLEVNMLRDEPDPPMMSCYSQIHRLTPASFHRAPPSTPEPHDDMDHDAGTSVSGRTDVFATADAAEQMAYLAMQLRRAQGAMQRRRLNRTSNKGAQAREAPGERGRIAKHLKRKHSRIPTRTRSLSPLSKHVFDLLENRSWFERDGSPDRLSDGGSWSEDEFGRLSLTGISSTMPCSIQSAAFRTSNGSGM
ncbi:hypothetical protein QFC20_004830 [Naganishia adeliensis]|uniref:Uncharacterized protein n=1 Tax=Naganishia adeliensis TaxID=92952 RepID=A0ACC2VX83_9TREE|nr:hypothetical protein QFC20_004830 [Naganishia adeliensis]